MTKEILNLLKKGLLFAAFAIPAYFVLLLITANWAPDPFKRNINFRMGSYGHMHSRLKEVRESGQVELLFLGSSHTYRGFDTRLFEAEGWRVFNLGSSSQSHLQTQVLLQRYLQSLRPKLIIYEVYPGTFATDGVESSTDILSNDVVDRYAWTMVLKTPGLKVFNTLVPALWSDWTGQKSTYIEEAVKGPDTYVPRGYVEMELQHYKTVRDTSSREWTWRSKQLRAFAQNLEMLKDAGAEVLLVMAPIPPGHYRNYKNTAVFDSLMQNLGRYYNFNDLMLLNDSLHFYDAHHLNQLGVEAFNRELIKLLKAEPEWLK